MKAIFDETEAGKGLWDVIVDLLINLFGLADQASDNIKSAKNPNNFFSQAPKSQDSTPVVPSRPENEAEGENLRGSISMAKLGGNDE